MCVFVKPYKGIYFFCIEKQEFSIWTKSEGREVIQ